MSTGSVTSVFRNLFLLIDTGVYWLVDQAYWLFSMLSEASLFTQTQIESFASRIYVLVSIIMFFKLGFSFINYIINPDSFTDKQKGGAALIKKIVITMALLVSVPTIFNEAYYLQKIIFQNHVIDKVLLGDTSSQTDDANKNNAVSTYAFLTFFKPTSYLEECRTYEGVSISAACEAALNKEDTTNHNPGTAYKAALANYDLKTIMQSEIANTTGIFTSNSGGDFYKADAFYLFDYNYPISTVVGGFLAWIMIGFCLDLAVRSVKLSFLQIIAPIPIILSLSPQQKNNTLANWGKECVSTWASLFIRVLVITFALSAIITINTDGGIFSFVTGGTNQFSMVTVFVMLGILLFAKEFPKLLEDILGIKGAGKMTFNAFKKLGSVPLVGGLATAGISYAGNFGKNVVAAGVNKIRGKDTNFKENMDFAGQEFKSRLQHSGIMGNDKAYSGDTQHKQVAKRNQEQRKKIIDAERGLESKDKLWRMGHKSAERQKLDENSTFDDYQRAGYKNKNFINAVMGIEQTKSALKDEQSKLRVSNEQVSALTNRLYNMDASDPEYSNVQVQLAQATHDRDGYQESVEKIEKSLKTRNDIFEQNIAPQSQKDYELYQARNVAKGERPTNYNTSASIPRFTDTHYHPEQNVIPQMTSQEQRLSEENRNNLASTTTSNNSQNNNDSSSGGGIISGIR